MGTFVFAISGAVSGVRHRIDLFGVLVLSFVAAMAGGIVRDVLLGATPPAAIQDWRCIAFSLLAGLVTFYWYPLVTKVKKSPLQVFEALGLGLFAVAGEALALQLGPLAAVLMGTKGHVRCAGTAPWSITQLFSGASKTSRSIGALLPFLVCADPPKINSMRCNARSRGGL